MEVGHSPCLKVLTRLAAAVPVNNRKLSCCKDDCSKPPTLNTGSTRRGRADWDKVLCSRRANLTHHQFSGEETHSSGTDRILRIDRINLPRLDQGLVNHHRDICPGGGEVGPQLSHIWISSHQSRLGRGSNFPLSPVG